MDLCKSKKFINLDGDLFLYYKDDKLVSLLDGNDIFWKRNGKIEEGGAGEIIEFKSGSKEYTDLAVKFFFDYEKEKYFIGKKEWVAKVRLFLFLLNGARVEQARS